ncbi:MAG: hypothetical protein AB3N15_10545 [Paracoccaceae bacterium]
MIGTGKKQSGFLFGGDTGLTHKDLQTKRRIADALMVGMGRAPQNAGEGLHAIGNALMIRNLNKQIERGEAQGGDEAKRLIAAAMMGKQPAPRTASTGPLTVIGLKPPTEDQQIGDEAMMALGKPEEMSVPGFFANLESEHNLPEGFLERTMMIESGGNTNAQNPNSSAGGAFQFIDSTAKQYGITDKTDLNQSATGAARLAADNAAHLRGVLGREPTAAELYLAHQQGAGGAAKMLANPNARAVDVVGRDAINLNGGDANMTAGEFAQKWLGKFGGGAAQSAPPQASDNSAIFAALSSPWVSDPGQRAMLMAELDRRNQADNRAYAQWQQANDPLRQMQIEKGRLELQQMQNPQLAQKDRYKVVDGQLVDLGASGGPSAVNLGGGQEPVNFEDESKLRKEFTGLQPVKDFQKQAGAYGRIVASAEDPSAAGDLALIFNYMKLLDPGSVVRESEFATAANSTGVDERVRNLYNRLLSGERLAPEQRRDFVGRAAKLYGQASSQHEEVAGQYGTTAENYGLDSARTIPDFRFKPKGAPPTSLRPNARPGTPEAQSAPQAGQTGVSRVELQGNPFSGLTASDILAQVEGRELTPAERQQLNAAIEYLEGAGQ